MTKNLLSLLLAVVMCLSLNVSVMALNEDSLTQKPDMTIVNLSDRISEQELQEIVSSSSAYMALEDGTVLPVDTVVTIEDISAATRMLLDQDAYKVTLSAAASNEKVVSDSADKNGAVTASATLQLIWIDGPLLDNSIKEVSGTLDVIKGTVTSANVRYGNGWVSAIQWTSKDVTGKSSFSYSPNSPCQCPKADYSISFKDATVSLFLVVSSSVLQ